MDEQAFPNTERRQQVPAVPEHVDSMLNTAQHFTLHQLESFGWKLAFVRRPMFEPIIPVLQSFDGNKYVTLDNEGELVDFPSNQIRQH